MAQDKCDVLVIGAGPAGTIVARKCNDAGLGVIIVEQDGWGGVCPLRGCEPKKTLVDAAYTLFRARDMAEMGVAGDLRLDWPSLMRFKRSQIDPISDAVKSSLEDAGITVVEGSARFRSETEVEVVGHGTIEADHIVVTVGASPRRLDVPGDELLLTNREFLDMDAMPSSVVFIGGGFISFEFASIAAAAGSDVTLLHHNDRVLKGFDGDLSRTLLEAMEDVGVNVALDRTILGVEKDGTGVAVTTRHADGREERFSAGAAFLGVGRVPQLSNLELEKGGVTASDKGIEVDQYLRNTGNDRVFAAGDCVEPGLPLTPVAALQADVLAENIINGPQGTCDLRGTASVVFTHPPLVSVGLREGEAREQGIDFAIHSGDAAKWSEHKRIGLKHAGYKVIEEKDTGRILGAHYLGEHAEEVGNIFGLAIRHRLTRQDLLSQPWGYPSFSYALWYMLS